jgi:hypothetical protein
MTKRRTRIIKDKKERGEWAESVFIARAREHGLPVSKPWGDSNSFDCVVGRPGKFVAVQVKCTVAKLESGKGYICSVCSSHKAYKAGAFDFLAAYVVLEDVWYIIPAKEIRGLKSISLCTTGGEAKYEGYREAWQLLREASGLETETEDPLLATSARSFDSAQDKSGAPAKPSDCAQGESGASTADAVEETPMGPGLVRMQNAFNFFRRQLEKGGRVPSS